VITIDDLHKLAESRLLDGKALFAAGRIAGAVYLSGYSVELVLKARICRTLGWEGWPDGSQFGKLNCLKTHDLATLLHLSGVESSLKKDQTLAASWLSVAEWDPETRYKVPDKDADKNDAKEMIEHANRLLEYFRQ